MVLLDLDAALFSCGYIFVVSCGILLLVCCLRMCSSCYKEGEESTPSSAEIVVIPRRAQLLATPPPIIVQEEEGSGQVAITIYSADETAAGNRNSSKDDNNILQTDPLELELECPICLLESEEDKSWVILRDFKHKFHSECMHLWLATNTYCPICRNYVPVKNP